MATPAQDNPELNSLARALGGLPLTAFHLDWEAWPDIRARIDQLGPAPALSEADDRASQYWYAWQHFRGEHHPQSVLLDADGCVRGLILRETTLEKITLPPLPTLEYACISGNGKLGQLNLPDTGFPLLRHADCSGNTLTVLHLTGTYPRLRMLDVRGNGLADLTLPASLPELVELHASQNKLTECVLPDDLPQLAYLYLNANEGMTQLRTESPLSALRTLHVAGNQLAALPAASYTALDTLYVKGNPLPYEDVLINGEDNAATLITLLRESYKGTLPNYRVRLIVVGNGRIGKTCLLKRLKGEEPDRDEPHTHGISILELDKTHLPGVESEALALKAWDFGGQEVYYATHQFFMSEGAAYLYVWTEEAIADANWKRYGKAPGQNRPRPHAYWLDNIRRRAGKSPVLVVKTHCEQGKREQFPADAFRKAYGPIAEPLVFDAFEEVEYHTRKLRGALAKIVDELPLLGSETPKTFLTLLDKIGQKKAAGVEEMSRADFDLLAEACTIDSENREGALDYLRLTGEVNHFPDHTDAGIRDRIFIHPHKLIQKLYVLIEDNAELEQREGVFDVQYAMKRIKSADWEDRLKLLEHFELIYKKGNEGETYIAPQYLKPLAEKSPNDRNSFQMHLDEKPLRFTLRYPAFMPENVMVNVLSHYGPYARDIAYRDAILFRKKEDPEACVIRCDETQRKVEIHCRNTPDADAMLHAVFQQFMDRSKNVEVQVAVCDDEWVRADALLSKDKSSEGVVNSLPLADGSKSVDAAPFYFLMGIPHSLHFLKESNPLVERPEPDRTKPAAKKILFFSANPENEARLAVDKELRDIQTELNMGRHKDAFELLFPQLAVKLPDLLRAMNDKPHVVHFSGHGTQEGIIIALEDNTSQIMTTKSLQRLFRDEGSVVECVLLNSCLSAAQAKTISELGILVIGYNIKVADKDAISFSKGFYNGLGEGKDYKAAFNDAMVFWDNQVGEDGLIEVWQNGKQLDWTE